MNKAGQKSFLIATLLVISMVSFLGCSEKTDEQEVPQELAKTIREWETDPFVAKNVDWVRNDMTSAYYESITLANDGKGYVVASKSPYAIVKYGEDGDVIWQGTRTIKGEYDGIRNYSALVPASDKQGYVLVGTAVKATANDEEVDGGWIAKFDEEGQQVWDTVCEGSAGQYYTDVTPIAGGGYIAVGYSLADVGGSSKNDGGTDYLIAKIDESGGKVWVKSHGSSKDEGFRTVTQLENGNFSAIGRANSGETTEAKEYDTHIIFSKEGEILSEEPCGGDLRKEYQSVIRTEDGGYIIIETGTAFEGGYNKDKLIAKFNAENECEWSNTIAWENEYFFYAIRTMTKADDGGYLGVGAYYKGGGLTADGGSEPTSFLVAKFSKKGDLESYDVFGINGGDFTDVVRADDGSYVAVGYSSLPDGVFPDGVIADEETRWNPYSDIAKTIIMKFRY